MIISKSTNNAKEDYLFNTPMLNAPTKNLDAFPQLEYVAITIPLQFKKCLEKSNVD